MDRFLANLGEMDHLRANLGEMDFGLCLLTHTVVYHNIPGRLANGTTVQVRIVKPKQDTSFLTGMYLIIGHLVHGGFCPTGTGLQALHGLWVESVQILS